MASPFSIFRRNQKIMLAVICVMAMFAFVFLDPLFKYLGRAGGTENPVVVKVNSHSYRASELGALMQSRQIVRNFLQRLALQWIQKAGRGRLAYSSQQHPRGCRKSGRQLAPGTDGPRGAAGGYPLGR